MPAIKPSNESEWIDASGRLTQGKRHRGKLVEDVAREDPGYLHWVLEDARDLSDEDASIIKANLYFRDRRR
jgi:hypothetical protein